MSDTIWEGEEYRLLPPGSIELTKLGNGWWTFWWKGSKFLVEILYTTYDDCLKSPKIYHIVKIN